jgi:hypothetical protein
MVLMKVYELSNELNITNKELIEMANKIEINVNSHLNNLEDEQVEMIKDYYNNVDSEPIKKKTNIKNEDKPVVKEEKVWKPDLNRQIAIKNIARGKLIYKSKRQMGYTVIWENTNDINYMELGEFINLKNSDRRFITEPWIRIMEDDEVEILKYANVYQYFKEMIEVKDIEDLFKLDFDRFTRKFKKLPDGYKNSVLEYAARMIKNGELDSIKIKNFLEKEMDMNLDILISDGISENKSNLIDIK